MSVAGTWSISTKTPMGTQEGELVFNVDGDTVTGTMSGAQGSVALEDCKADGNTVSWKAKISQPMPMTLDCTGTVDGDSISGNMKLGAFGNAPFSGTRK